MFEDKAKYEFNKKQISHLYCGTILKLSPFADRRTSSRAIKRLRCKSLKHNDGLNLDNKLIAAKMPYRVVLPADYNQSDETVLPTNLHLRFDRTFRWRIAQTGTIRGQLQIHNR